MNRRKEIKLVDRAHELHLEIARLTEELNSIKNQFKDEGDGVYTGHGVAINVFTRTQLKFNSSVAKSLMTPNQLEQCFVESESQVLTFEEI